MIRNIRHKSLAALYDNDQTKGVQQTHVKCLRQIFVLLDTATVIDNMDTPGLRLHALKGGYLGFHAVNVSGNWRVIFRFEDGDAFDIDYLDYH